MIFNYSQYYKSLNPQIKFVFIHSKIDYFCGYLYAVYKSNFTLTLLVFKENFTDQFLLNLIIFIIN